MSKRALKVGWVVPTVGIFGAVREMVEVSNSLVRRGHTVTIYHPDGGDCKWLPCLASCKPLNRAFVDKLDVMIGIVDWEPSLYSTVTRSSAKVKAICVLGFEPSERMAQSLQRKSAPEDAAQRIILDAVKRNLTILADSSWQVGWLQQQLNYPVGPAFGGLNTEMFHCIDRPENARKIVLFSNDPRPRKGTDTVLAAIELLKEELGDSVVFDSYWNRRFTQGQLVSFLQHGDVFLDGHRRAGWCNPVIEAMACGAVPVCTDIGAVRDFAIHGQTAMVVPVDDAVTMAKAAEKLLTDDNLRSRMRKSGVFHAKTFSYENVADNLESFFLEKMVEHDS